MRFSDPLQKPNRSKSKKTEEKKKATQKKLVIISDGDRTVWHHSNSITKPCHKQNTSEQKREKREKKIHFFWAIETWRTVSPLSNSPFVRISDGVVCEREKELHSRLVKDVCYRALEGNNKRWSGVVDLAYSGTCCFFIGYGRLWN